MTLITVAKRVERLVSDNSPIILTAIGVSGTLVTAFLTGKASIKAFDILNEEFSHLEKILSDEEFEKIYTLRYQFNHVWKLYIPAAGMAAITISAIIGANRVGTRRAAALASVYSLSEKAFAEYKDKVVEKMGANKELALRDELAQDRVSRNPASEREVIITGNGEVLCYEAFTGRYFNSSMETLKKAQNDTNYQVLNSMYASLSDFYSKISLPTTSYSDEVGWNSDKMLELHFSTTLSEDGRPCISVGFLVAPVRDFYRLR